MPRECDGARLTEMLVWEMDEMWLCCGHVGDTRGSGSVSSAADVLWMSVVRGSWWEMCMCLARGGVGGEGGGGEWMRGLGLGFTNPARTRGVLGVCLCFGCGGMCGVGGERVGGLDQGLEVWGGIMSV